MSSNFSCSNNIHHLFPTHTSHAFM